MSKGEEQIAKILSAARIPYKREVCLPGLKSLKGKPLRFDFALLDKKGRIIALIEYDGKQHFQWTKIFQKTPLEFHYLQQSDRRKNAYCLIKGIPLIRIPYWDNEILTLEKILTEPSYKVKNVDHNILLKQR